MLQRIDADQAETLDIFAAVRRDSTFTFFRPGLGQSLALGGFPFLPPLGPRVLGRNVEQQRSLVLQVGKAAPQRRKAFVSTSGQVVRFC